MNYTEAHEYNYRNLSDEHSNNIFEIHANYNILDNVYDDYAYYNHNHYIDYTVYNNTNAINSTDILNLADIEELQDFNIPQAPIINDNHFLPI